MTRHGTPVSEEVETLRAGAPDRRLLERLAASSRDAWVTTSPDGTILDANAAAAALLGTRRPTLLRKSLGAFAADAAEFGGVLARAAAGEPLERIKLRVKPRVGDPLVVTAGAALDPGGRVSWILVATQRVGLAAAIDAAPAEHLRAVLDGVADAILVVDFALKVQYANRAAKALLESPLRPGTAMPEEWEGVSLGAVARDLRQDGRAAADNVATTRHGHIYSLRALPDPRGRSVVLIIAEASTRARRDEAERNFVANAAHELRTPLASIAGAVEVLQAGAKDVPHARDRFLDHMARECARLQRLAAALLTLARAETGAEPPRLDVVELQPLLRRIAAGLRTEAGVEVKVECLPTLAALANPGLLEQALFNLAENAAAHTREGRIVLCAAEAGRSEVTVSVADTGKGMSAAELDRAIERFHRGSTSSSSSRCSGGSRPGSVPRRASR